MTEKICKIRSSVAKQKPLIHCITNPISINGCANTILAVGAKPIMAEHPKEVSEITETADALLLNLGNITDARMESAKISLTCAKEKGIPTLLDVVGIACSTFRRTLTKELLSISVPAVIKGNYSEIAALYDNTYASPGVDADARLSVRAVTDAASSLARTYQTVILATGETDIVSDGTKTLYIKNGTKQLPSLTGTGCMLGSLCTSFLTAASPLHAAASACGYFGICGQLAESEKGGGTFYMQLLDNLSTLREEEIIKRIHMEVST